MVKVGIAVRNLEVGAAIPMISQQVIRGADPEKIRFVVLADRFYEGIARHESVERIEVKPKGIPWRIWVNSPEMNRRLADVDLFLGLDNTVPLTLRKVRILFLYDLYGWLALFRRYYEFLLESSANELFTFFILKPLSAWLADLVVVQSHYTKKTVQKILKVPERKIRVLRLGVSQNIYRRDESEVVRVLKNRGIPGNYVLTVGNYRYHRNYKRLIRVFSDFSEDLALVIRGSAGERGRKLAGGVRNVFFIEEKLSEHEMAALYSGALFLAHVTLMEGFGIPVLEAMRCGCPVLASNRCSIPEIALDGALYVNPESEEEMKEGFRRIMGDRNLRERLISRGFEISSKYTEQRFIEELTDIIYEYA